MPEPADAWQVRERRNGAVVRTGEVRDRLGRLRSAQADALRASGRPGTLGETDRLRQVAQLEEIVARTHECAAELYEIWSKQHTATQPGALVHRARRHREIAAATRSVDRVAEHTLRGFEARVEAGRPTTGKARHLVALSALERLRALMERRIEETVTAGRREGATWAEIASALRVTRQTAHQRYRRRTS